jgi:diguanylate cyclase (GGDEF)-like protein/PAS domain S-box-containing protein
MIPRIENLDGDELRTLLLEQQAILDNATVGILFSRNRSVAASNRLCVEMFGYTPKEMIGLPGMKLCLSPEAYAALGRNAAPKLATGQSFVDEIQFRRKDGSTFWSRVSAKAIDPLHPHDGTIWIIADIDTERAVREALKLATHELEAVFETSIIGMAVLHERKILNCNRRYAELLGYSRNELLGKTTHQFHLSDADYDNSIAKFLDDLLFGNEHRAEVRLRRRNGSTFWASLSARAFDQSLPEKGSVWMLEDITDRKSVDERMQASLAEQELIFNNAAVGMMFVRNRIFSRCNRKFEEIFGYAEGELLGHSTLLLYPTLREYDEHGMKSHEALLNGETVIGEHCLRRKNSSSIWVRATGRRADTNGPGLDVIWIFEDITERRRAEEELERAHEELEQRVVERTTELATTNVQLKEEIFERLQAEQRIWHIAHHDALTGLPNRSLLLDRLDQALPQASRAGQQMAVMFLDLDRFKSVNDTLGHHVGDQLLKHVAERLRETVRATDTVSRLGGDEFVVLLNEIQSPADASIVAEKIIESLGTAAQIDEHSLYATPSIGISIYPNDGDGSYALIKNADAAMYYAKEKGRNNYQFFTPSMNEKAQLFFSQEQRLRAAFKQNQFVLHFQPLIDYQRGTVSGMEVLLRWQHPELGVILPAEFIPVAEEIGLILPLGEWVLREACRQNKEWQAQGYPALPMSINLSPRQFRQKDLVDTIRRILREAGLPPHLLELEVTEASLMQDADATLTKLHQLSEMGIRLSIDNFGTGYSSLAYLKRFNLHKLKIDRSFVRDLCLDGDDAAIISTIVGMANNLGLRTMAKGVETGAQLEALLGFGCHQFQGYLFSHPLPASDADQIFRPSFITLTE